MSLISYIKYIDSLVGKPFTQLNALFYIYKSMIYFYYYRLFRTFYSSAFKDNLNYKSIAKDLESNGFAKLYNVIPLSSINKIKYFLDYSILNKNNLNSTDPESSHPYLFVLQPQLYENEILDVALSDLIIGISSCYLKSKPSLTGFNLRKSYTNFDSPYETQYYHSDRNSIKFLKFFIYLNDVDEFGGPFVYIKSSHKNKFFGWLKKYRWSDYEIENHYPNMKIICTGNAGDLLIADTTGFHKGLKPEKNERSMLTINVSIHPEFLGNESAFKVSNVVFEKIPKNKRFFVDHLKVV